MMTRFRCCGLIVGEAPGAQVPGRNRRVTPIPATRGA